MKDGKIYDFIFVLIFGFLFFGIGAGFAVWSIRTLREAADMRAWDETPARIQNCELIRHKGSKGGATYKVSATYNYSYGGGDGAEPREHTSNRVYLEDVGDSDYQHHNKILRTLQNAKDSGGTVPCFVNPRDPSKAVLFPEPDRFFILFKQFFAMFFGGIGLGIICGSFLMLSVKRPRKIKSDDYRRDYRDTHRANNAPAHAPGQIRMEGEKTHITLAVVTIAESAYAVAVFYLLVLVLGFGGIRWLSYIPFAAVAILICVSLYHWKRFEKFGVSVLTLTPNPGVAGQTLQCAVHIPRRFNTEITATLRYAHQYTARSGKNSTTHTNTVWYKPETVAAHFAGDDASLVRVEYEIPANYHSSARRKRDGNWWELTLASKMSGVNYKAVFEVPVVKA